MSKIIDIKTPAQSNEHADLKQVEKSLIETNELLDQHFEKHGEIELTQSELKFESPLHFYQKLIKWLSRFFKA